MTLTDLANLALEDLSERAISSIDDKSDEKACKLNRQVFKTIDEVQSMHRWSCLVHTVRLVKSGKFIGTGESTFILPSGFLNIVDCCPRVAWRIEGKVLIAPVEEIQVSYVRRSTNPDEWDVNLRGAVIAKLKANIALSQTADSNIAKYTYQQAELEIPKYMRNDTFKRENRKLPYRSKFFDGW